MTPAGTSNELDVQNGWEENTHKHRVQYSWNFWRGVQQRAINKQSFGGMFNKELLISSNRFDSETETDVGSYELLFKEKSERA